MKKRILSFALALLMVLSLMPTAAVTAQAATVAGSLNYPISEEDCYIIYKNYFGYEMKSGEDYTITVDRYGEGDEERLAFGIYRLNSNTGGYTLQGVFYVYVNTGICKRDGIVFQADDYYAVGSCGDNLTGWQKVYYDFIVADKAEKDFDWEYVTYELVYLNDDSIPELWIDYCFSYAGTRIMSYYNDQLVTSSLSAGTLTYEERNNVFYHSWGHMGQFSDTVYQLTDEGLTKTATGTYHMYDENGNLTSDFHYKWENSSVAEDQYKQNLSSYVNPDTAFSTGSEDSEIYDYTGILEYLNAKGNNDSEGTETTPVSSDFNESIYRAAFIIDPWSVTDYDTGCNEFYYIDSLRYLKTPGRALEESAQKSGYGDSAVAWQAFELVMDTIDDPSTPLTYHMEQQDMYTAILLDAFRVAVELEEKNQAEAFLDEVNDFADAISEEIESLVTIDLWDSGEFQNMDDKTMKALCDSTEKQLKKDYPELADAKDILKSINIVADMVGDYLTFCENLFSYAKLYSMSETMKEVLREMNNEVATDGSQQYLRMALNDCIKILEYSQDEFVEKIALGEVVKIAGTRGLKICTSKFWDTLMTTVKSSYPVVGSILVGAKTGMLISELLFGTSATKGKYFELTAITEVEGVLDQVLLKLDDRFLDSRTAFNAQTYLDGVSVRYSLLDQECEAAYEYTDSIETTVYSQFMEVFDCSQDSQLKPRIQALQASYQDQYNYISTHWINSLDEELYKQYESRLNKPTDICASYFIACPVNVYVYDESGVLVASVVDEKPFASGNVTIAVENENKTIEFFDDAAYEIKCVSYGEGTMDITIMEYEDGNSVRQAEFYDIPLEQSSIYEITANEDPDIYQIQAQDKAICADYDSNASGTKQYTVTISDGYIETTEGATTQWVCTENQRIDISAYVPEGYTFIRWECSAGTVRDIYNQNTTLIVPSQDITVRAVLGNNPFVDVQPNMWFYDSVLWAVENGITTGMTETTFVPDGTCTRAQIVTFLWRAKGCPEPISSDNPFTDVFYTDYYYKAVLWAMEKGITTGTSDTTFSPEDGCTRGQVATFLWRSQTTPASVNPVNSFVDIDPNAYYYNAVLWAVENGITNGTSTTTFAPDQICTRGQIVTFLYRNDTVQQSINRYTYHCEDVSWTEANERAKTLGGHLVHIDSVGEMGYLMARIYEMDYEAKYTLLGGKRDLDGAEYYWVDTDGNKVGGSLNDESNWANALWLCGEPSLEYAGHQEDVMSMQYSDSDGRWGWNDLPDEVLEEDSSKKGNIVYIVEYED